MNTSMELIACICEGSAEHAILDILLEKNLLIFSELLDDKIIRTRSAERFEKEYLRKNFIRPLTIYRILDSRKENFKLSSLYRNKISVINIITAPEIEMLIIHCEDKYEDFKKYQSKQNMKPSDYCKIVLKMKTVKSYDFIYSYFSDENKLLNAIKDYKKKSNLPKAEKTLLDILK